MKRFKNIGVIKNEINFDNKKLDDFENRIGSMKNDKSWAKDDLVKLFFQMIPDFGHMETGKYFDSKM